MTDSTGYSLLDRPIWSSLTTVHSRHASGTDLAKRFEPDISPFAASMDDSAESLSELLSLVPENGNLMLMQADPLVCPDNGHFTQQSRGIQMVFDKFRHGTVPSHEHLELGDEDAHEMHALAQLTRPGPFLQRTHCLGGFIGIRIDGQLIAMAGERMKQPGFTEISGVCTHPDARGRGLAAQLISTLTSRVIERNQIPYLHAYAANTSAINIYRSLGFEHRTNVNVAVLEHRQRARRS